MTNVIQFKPRLENRTLSDDGTLEPQTRYECLMYFKRRILDQGYPQLYESLCTAILDAQYAHDNPHLAEIVNIYYSYDA